MNSILNRKKRRKLGDLKFLRNITRNLVLQKGKHRAVKQLLMDDQILPFLKNDFLPNSSYLLVNHFISDILTLNSDLRNLVIIANLYFENIIDELIKDNFSKPDALDNFDYYQKLKVIEAFGILNNSTMEFLIFINKMRNKFAHNLDYDMPDSDIQQIPLFVVVSNRFKYKIKKYRMKRNHYLFVVECIDVLLEIIEQHPKIAKIVKQ